jgi:ERCC4-type nuclease
LKSLKRIINASVQELAMCPGLGEQKVRRLYQAFHEPFLVPREEDEEDDVVIDDYSAILDQ